jgi:1-deoxy-D-xylulose-5-phosphate reductoisomerase
LFSPLRKRIAVLGSTGSIGRSTLDIVSAYPDRFQILALAAGKNVELLAEQARQFRPQFIAVSSESDAEALRQELNRAALERTEIVAGSAGLIRAATHPAADLVVSAIVGVAGLEATYEAVKAGKAVGLANKEALVVAGELITAEARRQGTALLPIDSEHNAIHQCLRAGEHHEVERIWLTASGGPFLNTPHSQFSRITPEQALKHPTWNMGRRISVDSATLMNKGLEVIEGCRLFDLPPSRIEVLIHPQSTVHSMVEFADGSVIAQLSITDMRLPILYALTYPERVESGMKLPVGELRRLEFFPPDLEKFPCLRLAYEAAEAGGAKTIALNAADEIAVAAFLEEQIGFADIPEVVRTVVGETFDRHPESIKEVLALDVEARQVARSYVSHLRTPSALATKLRD